MNSIIVKNRKRKQTSFSVGLVGVNFLNTKAYINADIIHLHWINDGFFNNIKFIYNFG